MKAATPTTAPTDHALRDRAEAQVGPPPPATAPDPERLLHELQVHQIELEFQNDELRLAHDALNAALERYTDLYDFAPIGYFTLDRTGRIVQLNLAGAEWLGQVRSALVGRRLGDLLSNADKRVLADYLATVFAGQARPATLRNRAAGGGPESALGLLRSPP